MDSRAKMQTSTNVNRGSTLPTPGVEAYKSPTSAPTATPISVPRDACRRCGQFGHWSNQCPKPRSSQSQDNTGVSQAPVNISLLSVRDLPTTRLAMERSGFKGLVTEEPLSNEICLPMVIAGSILVSALVDTGASHSIIDPSVVQAAQLELLPEHRMISLAAPDHNPLAFGCTKPISCVSGHFDVSHSFIVMPLAHTKCLIGRDLLPHLGVHVLINALSAETAAPSSHISDTTSLDLDHTPVFKTLPADLQDTIIDIPHEIPQEVKTLLEVNAAIPANQRCTHPDSVIALETGSAAPVFRRPYRVPQTLEAKVSDVITQWLRDDVIESAPAGTRWNSPLVVVSKHNGDPRVCIDPRPLNALLENGDNFPLPVVTDIIDRMAGAKIFSALDLKSGFHQFTIRSQDRHKLAFSWAGTQYVFVSAPFGLKHLSSAFQRVLSDIFAPYPFVAVYVDNIYIFSVTVQEHIWHIIKVIELLNAACLRLNLAKCLFFLLQIDVLGYIVSASGVSLDRSKLIHLEAVPLPATAKQMQAFLGFANFFRRFVPAFSTIASPLDALRHVPTFQLDQDQQAAFFALKRALLSAPLLSFPDFNRPFALATDASATGIGAVLLQPSPGTNAWPDIIDSTCNIVAFFSRALSTSERNYAANKRELLAVVFGLEKCRYYLWGRHFLLLTDHRSLSFMFSQRDLSPLLFRWFAEIMEFSFDIRHIPGTTNVLPDALSRLYPIPERTTNDMFNHDLTPRLNAIQLAPEDSTLLAVPPKDQRHAMLTDAHAQGHLGAKSIVKRIHECGFNWPSIAVEARNLVAACTACQRFIVSRQGFHPLQPIVANYPMSHVAVDLAGPLPRSPRGNVYLLVLICLFTRFVFLRALPSKEAQIVAAVLYLIFCEAGFPDILQSDNGPEFVNGIIDRLLELMQADHRLITAYNARANGVAERHVGLSISSIRKMLEGALVNWDLKLASTQLALNTRVVELHGSAPFSMFYARSFPSFRRAALPSVESDQAPVAVTSSTDSEDSKYEDWKTTIKQMESVVFPALREYTHRSNSRRTERFNSTHRLISFKPGTYVMTRDPLRAGKLEPRHEGPYKIGRRNRGGTYTLLDHDGTILARNYAPSQLVPVPGPSLPVDSDTIFTVDHIISHRELSAGRYEYFIKWRGYDESHNSWEPSSSFFDVTPITKYWRAAPPAVILPSAVRVNPTATLTVPKRSLSSTRTRPGIPHRYRSE